ncbi:VWA domain-containing protein [Rhodopseudomonas pseudopalustris]|uniref:vWA domain-containing protein n=1 Tax=Rhodopseudomonas pseudopalustris TaxID=1513892 RepID=UPI003F97305C
MSAQIEFADNPEDRCPVVLLLDTSGSMMEDGKIDALNNGIAQFKSDVLADKIASLRVEVSIITFGGSVQVVHEFSTADKLSLQPFQPMGNTPLGEAVNAALDEIEVRKAEYKSGGVNYFRPWVWLMTDGAPTDAWQAAAARAKQAANDKKVQLFCVGVGRAANMDVLREFSNSPPMQLEGLQFSEMFRWLSTSLSRVSQAKAGDPVALPPVQGWGTVFA